MMARLLRLVPARLAGRLTRHAVPLAVVLVGAVLLAGVAVAALVSPGALGLSAARVSQTTDIPETLQASGLHERDADLDGLSDALENYLYGTDPDDWDSSGLGVPDGWLAQFGFDPLSPLTAAARGAAPPPHELPAAYADGYPLEYTPTLAAYYAVGKPESYRPGVDAPWWRAGAFADPSDWDQTGTGIPTGWLVHHGLDLATVQPDRVAPGSLGNLTVRQAFEHGADPLARDSDGDGLDDWAEIHATLTDPSRFSTAGTGIADGWLVRFGLDPFDPEAGTRDADLDGLTNLEEFQISHETFRDEVEASGLAVLYARGLDPLDWQTARTGIPDGWYVRYGLSPFGAEVERVIGRASDFPEIRDLDAAPEGFEPLPDLTFTVRGAYEYARPDDWNESVHGVWWGGTNPVTLDTDEDGLPDPIEIRGWYANVTFDTGPEARPRAYLATSNPLEPDSDGDGLTDLEEYRGRAACSQDDVRAFPPTDPRNRDTAFSGLSDHEKVCGVQRADARYDLGRAQEGRVFLDPTRADSARDHMRDGARLDFWHERWTQYRQNPAYPYEGSLYETVFEWTELYARFAGLSRDATLAQFRPDGDVDGDGAPNALDPDPAGGLHAQRFAEPGAPADKTYLLGGPQIAPALYRHTEHASPVPHSASDPANPDTDGDGLPDAWETRYGRFDPAANGWDLDPAKSDSDGDGVPDGEANNDEDVVTWYAYNRRGGGTERITNTFAFDNLLEFRAGTDPNEVSTMRDGVGDGWKVFWGTRLVDGTYPNLVSARDASIGTVALDRADDIEMAISERGIQPTADLKGAGAKTAGHVRFANVTSCSDAPALRALARPDEDPDQVTCYAGRDLGGGDMVVARVPGAFRLTYADEARLRTNPYLDDSDGDGAPDAYEARYLVRTPGGSAFPDPAHADGDKDPDGDGLGLADECASRDGGRSCGQDVALVDGQALGAGADPNDVDTDGDGIDDGIEYEAGLNLLDPSDVESFSDPTIDTDRDGVPDYQELTGWKLQTPDAQTVTVRTDPQDPDTDGDGLLDGDDVVLDPVKDAARVAAWRARGVAHDTLADGSVAFFGERVRSASFGVRPDDMFAAHPEVPDGWLAYHRQNPAQRAIEVSEYAAFRPAWWDEQAHGVWWWGARPGFQPVDDLDGDGLHDRNGEDPMPFSRLNRVGPVTDPQELEAFVDGAGSAAVVRERAQTLGEGAGDPDAARDAAAARVNPATGVPVSRDRARVAIVDVDAPPVIGKGEAFNVTGRVVLDERASGQPDGALLQTDADGGPLGLANRTVLVSFFRADRETIVGAGFTNATGHFEVTANVTADQRVRIPASGLVLLDRVKGVVPLRFDPALVTPGDDTFGEPNRIVVWVANTSAASQPGHPTHGVHKAWLQAADGSFAVRDTNATGFAASAPHPVKVTARTLLTTTVNPVAENGQRLVGDVRLEDASGAGIPNRLVVVSWSGSTAPIELRNLTTDVNGRVNLTRLGIPVGVREPGAHTLVAEFESTDANLVGARQTFTVAVRDPTVLHARLDAASVTVGDLVGVSGTLATASVRLPDGSTLASEPVGGADVRLRLGGVDETVRTDSLGRFDAKLLVPGSLVAGSQPLQADFAGTATHSPSDASLTLTVKRTASLVGLTRLDGPRGSDALLRGRLVDNEGGGFAGPVHVFSAAGARLAAVDADEEGRFSARVALSSLPLGAQSIRVAFPGDAGHAAAENFTQARVTSATRLALEHAPEEVVRGDVLAVRARLVDDRGEPVPAQPVRLSWRGEPVETGVTDARGAVSFLLRTDRADRPAQVALGLSYEPPVTAAYQGAVAGRVVRIVAGTELSLAPQVVHRGPVAVTGTLLDDEGRPLPGSVVSIQLDGEAFGEARVARNGSFELARPLPADRPLGPATLSATYLGTATLAGDTANATWQVRSPLTLQLTKLPALVRGERAPLEGTLVDDRGQPVDATLSVSLGGRALGSAPVVGGKLRHALDVPADLPRGAATLRLDAPATARHDALLHELPVVVKARPKVEVELPAVAVRGFSFGGDLRLYDDAGEPLRNTSFAYTLGEGRGAVLGQTDAEGRATLAGVAPVTGDAVLALTVRGGDELLPTQYSAGAMTLVGPATPVGYASLVLAVLAVLLVAAAVVAIALLRRRQLAEARDIVEEAIRDLLAGNEYAGTIFLCYRRLAAHLARHGFAQKESETPREFALGVRKALPIGAVPLRDFIQVFEEARYSDHPIGSAERDAAVESLASVRNELDRLLGAKGAAA